MPDGPYLIGIRPHHVTPADGNAGSVTVSGTVQIAEISGSQSTIHFNIEDNNWVSESQGVHPYKVGDSVQLYLNVDRCFYFHTGGELVTS